MHFAQRRGWIFVALFGGAFLGLFPVSLAAQAGAPPAEEAPAQEEPEDIQVDSPMVVEVRLPEKLGSIAPRPGTAYQQVFSEMRRQVCNRIRIAQLKVSRSTDNKGRAAITFEPTVHYRKDFRLSIEVVSGSETLLTKEINFEIPRGGGLPAGLVAYGASLSLSPAAKLTIEEEKWKAAFSADSAPIVRLTVTAKTKKAKRAKE